MPQAARERGHTVNMFNTMHCASGISDAVDFVGAAEQKAVDDGATGCGQC